MGSVWSSDIHEVTEVVGDAVPLFDLVGKITGALKSLKGTLGMYGL